MSLVTALRAPRSARARLAWRLGFGALLMIAAAWVFGAIAEDVVTSDRLTTLDADIARWLHRHASVGVTSWMYAITQVSSTVAISCYTVLAAAWLYVKRQWHWLVTLVVAVGGGLALNTLMKLAFHRARPVFDDPLLTLSSYSFPSGHVAASTIFYGLVVAWVFTRTRAARWRVAAVVFAFLLTAIVAFTRMYLGVHYLSDVAAAFAEGVFWLALCLGAFATFWRERATDPAGPARDDSPTPVRDR